MAITTSELDAILRALPWPVAVVGADARIAATNAPLDAILGEHPVGRHHITAFRQPALLDAIARARQTGEAQQTRYFGRDGDRDVTWAVQVAPELGRMIVSFEDLSAAEDAIQMRRDFVANVSHELRTPLTALLGFIETLQGPARDDAAARARFLELMAGEAQRMTSLIDDLLSLSRVEENERLRPTAPVDLHAMFASVEEVMGPRAQAAGVELKFDLPRDLPKVPGDADQLRQVFTNLVENALKYAASGGEVLICGNPEQHHRRLRGPGVLLQVRDRGEGIDAHHLPRLTERFYRIDGHRSRAVGGTGLGLAIVKHIVNRHRGRFRIDSQKGKGTTVSVLLPTGPLS